MTRVTIPESGEILFSGVHDRKESYDRRNARNNPRRVGGGREYLGMAPRKDQAEQLNALRKEYRDRQKQS